MRTAKYLVWHSQSSARLASKCPVGPAFFAISVFKNNSVRFHKIKLLFTLIYIVADHPRWLFCVYILQALGLLAWDMIPFALWEVHGRKPSTYVLKPPKLGALREVACDNIYTYMYFQF